MTFAWSGHVVRLISIISEGMEKWRTENAPCVMEVVEKIKCTENS